MATTENLANGTGSQDTFPFTFPYIKDADIKVSVGGVVKTVTTHYTLSTPTTIKFTSGNLPPSGTNNVRIYRKTDNTALKATFYPGSAIRAGDLNDNSTQNLYVVQELENEVASAWKRGDDTIDSTETWHTSDDTKVGTTKAIENRINSQIDTALENDVLAGTDLAKTASGGQVTINHSVGGANSTVNNSNGTVLQDITISAQGHVTAIGSKNLNDVYYTETELNAGQLDNRYFTETESDARFQPLDAELTELATMGSTTAAALADLTEAEVQILDGATVTTAELNILDGVTSTAAELNILDGVTATAAELNIMDGVTASTAELNKTDGLTSTPTELNILDGATTNTSEINKLDGVTASTAELNIVSGKTFKTSSGTLTTTSDTEIPSSKVIAAHVASSITAVGGFKSIADEVSFPATANQPASGVVVSINNAAGVVINGSGVSTTGRTTDGTPATVTINSFPSSLYGETLAAGVGLLVTSTSTSNTYTYHKLLAAETDVKQLSDDINDFNARYRIASSAPGSNNDEGDLYFDTAANKMKVYNGSAWDDVASVGSFYINTISSSSGTGGGSATFNGSAYRFTLSNPASGGAQQLIVSINGVIQKPNSGTGQPSEGFAIDGNDIIFSAAPASGSDYFIVTQGSSVSIGTPSANSVNSSHIIDGSIVDGDISSSAAISEGKLGIHNAPATGKYLKYTSNGMEWADGASEGTDVKSTGESGTTKFLRVDGDGTCSWQVPSYVTVVDEDNMSSNSATSVPSQQSTKAYVDTQIGAISAAPEITGTATGAITAEKAVAVRSDGNLEEIVETISVNNPITAGGLENIDGGSGHTNYFNAFPKIAIAPNGAVVTLMKRGSGQDLFGTLGTINTSSNVVAWNPSTSFNVYNDHNVNRAAIAVGKDTSGNANTFLLATNQAQNAIAMRGAVPNSGITALDMGSTAHLGQSGGGGTGDPFAIVFNDDDDHFYICHKWAGSGGGTNDRQYLRKIAVTSGGSSSSCSEVGSAVGGSNSTSNGGYISLVIDPINYHIYSFYNVYAGDAIQMIAWTWNGSAYSEQSAVTVISSAHDYSEPSAVWDSKLNKIVLCYQADDEDGYAIVGTPASGGATVSWGTAVEFNDADTTSIHAVYDSNTGRVIIQTKDEGANEKTSWFSGLVSGTSISFTSSKYTDTSYYPKILNMDIAFDSNTNRLVGIYVATNDSDKPKSIVLNSGSAATNITGENFVGFAKSTVSNGAACTVKVVGNTSTQSSLTPGKTYYVQDNGSVGLTAGSVTQVAGRSLSSTKLLIK